MLSQCQGLGIAYSGMREIQPDHEMETRVMWGYILYQGYIGFYRQNGKEHGNYRIMYCRVVETRVMWGIFGVVQ